MKDASATLRNTYFKLFPLLSARHKQKVYGYALMTKNLSGDFVEDVMCACMQARHFQVPA